MCKEFLISVRDQYHQSELLGKGKILDGFVAASGYNRKYAIKQLNGKNEIIKESLSRKLLTKISRIL
ncbi:MAG: hypothetical protein JKY67_17170 [Pseudomonadales bacterium]|nr:hypothetical protein [Pseudomonadales bacterium]